MDGRYIASGSDDKSIKVWNLKEKKNEFTLNNLKSNLLSSTVDDSESKLSSVKSIAFSPNGKILAGGLQDGNIVLWSFTDDIKVQLNGHSDSVNAVVFSADGKLFASGSSDHSIKLWSLKKKAKIST